MFTKPFHDFLTHDAFLSEGGAPRRCGRRLSRNAASEGGQHGFPASDVTQRSEAAPRASPLAWRNGAPHERGAGGESDPRILTAGTASGRVSRFTSQFTVNPPPRGSLSPQCSLREGHRAGHEVGAGKAKPGGTTAVSIGTESVRGCGPGVRLPWQSLGRCWGSAVHSVRKGMDRFGDFLLPTHAVAVASDVDDVAPVEQAVGQLGGQDREAKDRTSSGDVSVGHATRQIPSTP